MMIRKAKQNLKKKVQFFFGRNKRIQTEPAEIKKLSYDELKKQQVRTQAMADFLDRCRDDHPPF